MQNQSEIAIERTRNPRTCPEPKDLGFGRHFSDHMFIADYSPTMGWHVPRVVPYQSLHLDPGAAVLHYGQALFEGLKAFRQDNGKVHLFRPEMNWRRMRASAERLCMPTPPLDLFLLSLQTLLQVDQSWIPSAPDTSLYIRPTLIATESFLGVRPAEKYTFFVITSPVGAYYGDKQSAVNIWVEAEFSRAAPGGVGAAKAAGNYAASLLAARDAKARGFAQVLWLDAAQKSSVEEVGTMNVFFVINGKLVTPPLGGTILPGVMRDSVLQLARQWKVSVEERPIPWAEVVAAHRAGQLQEAFGTGTAAQITPIGEFADTKGTYRLPPDGALASRFLKHFRDFNRGLLPDPDSWRYQLEI